MRASLIIVVAVLLTAVATGNAHAQTSSPIPPSCAASTSAASAYNSGIRLGERMVQTSWRNVNDCGRVDYYMEVLQANVSRLTIPQPASLATVCRYAGTVDGVYNALDTLYFTCADQCFLDGELIGELSAEIYCELSIALGGLVEADDFIRGPVQVCGLNFEIGCDSAFIGNTLSYANPDGVCEPFTEDEFFTVWDQARNNSCSYEPEPEPMPVGSDEPRT